VLSDGEFPRFTTRYHHLLIPAPPMAWIGSLIRHLFGREYRWLHHVRAFAWPARSIEKIAANPCPYAGRRQGPCQLVRFGKNYPGGRQAFPKVRLRKVQETDLANFRAFRWAYWGLKKMGPSHDRIFSACWICRPEGGG